MLYTTVVLIAASVGQVADSPKEKEDGWQPIFLKMAEDYVIRSEEENPRTFALRKTPILRWSQPVRGGDDGATYVWMDRGHPVVIGAIFAYPNADQSRTVVHEFHSLAQTAIHGTWKPKVNWRPQQPGIDLKEITGAPAPADKPAARLTQMRAILREFTARSIAPNDRPWELRLMPQPLVRYETDENDPIIDGAVFAFAQGTDPEILFVIEAERKPTGSGWKYGCGRFSDYRLELKHKDRIVWEIGQSNFGNLNGVYFATDGEVRKPPPGATALKDRKRPDEEK